MRTTSLMQQFTTPMMKQYLAIKKQYQDCLLFYRMGDFYELFLEDAEIGARILNITLTSRAKGKDGRIPMAGVPYHAVDSYLSKLVKAGYKVAICEQMSLPNKTGIIDREVIRIVTPGTMLDEKALEKKENNYIIAFSYNKDALAFTVADISTGYFATSEIQSTNRDQIIKDELTRLRPAECILPDSLYNDPQFLRILKTEHGMNIFPFAAWESLANDAKKILKHHFSVTTLAGFGIEDKALAIQTSAALLGYLQETQKGSIGHIKKISVLSLNKSLVLDRSTILNLELFSTIREQNNKGSLLSVLDETVTAMGARLLKQWLRKPLVNKDEITKRHEAVEQLMKLRSKRNELRAILQKVNDIERLISRLSVGIGNARDLVNLKESLKVVLELKKILADIPTELMQEIIANIKTDLSSIITLIETNLVSEPPISLKEGGIIKSGINQELDELRKISSGSRDWVLEFEQKERQRTGIASLKVRFNQVFGFYIEVSKSNLHSVPSNYFRKQTLVNGERFTTPSLKEQEEIILTAEEKMNALEYQLYQTILTTVLRSVRLIQEAAESIAVLDCLVNFAHIAEKNNYVRPKLLYSGEMRIKGGRHPVVEKLLEEKQFVPNDLALDNIDCQLLLITGPNMAGKSVFIRQVAVIVLLCQLGSFVPAESAHLSLVDRIFVRSGASDVISQGLSTFMVEMVETATILHNATENSLIIMDEIGRGTSTYDGISIAWAVAEYLVTSASARPSRDGPKTLFATHYHELQSLEEYYPTKIKNFHMSVTNNGENEPIFLHTIMPGGASHSFGVAVAKLAGIPEEVIKRANEMLGELEKRANSTANPPSVGTPPLLKGERRDFSPTNANLVNHVIQKELDQIDIHQMTPLDALNKLAELKDLLKQAEKENTEVLRKESYEN